VLNLQLGTFGSPRDICGEGKEETKEESKVSEAAHPFSNVNEPEMFEIVERS